MCGCVDICLCVCVIVFHPSRMADNNIVSPIRMIEELKREIEHFERFAQKQNFCFHLPVGGQDIFYQTIPT